MSCREAEFGAARSLFVEQISYEALVNRLYQHGRAAVRGRVEILKREGAIAEHDEMPRTMTSRSFNRNERSAGCHSENGL